MKRIVFWLTVLVLCITMQGQSQEINIGQKWPRQSLPRLLNGSDLTLSHQAIQGKSIIFDFFATWCTVCIKGLPLLDSLQKRYKNDIQIVIVSAESEAVVENFLSNSPVGRSVKLPFLFEDTVLASQFPHIALPHVVWIDEKNSVKAITGKEYVTNGNIQKFLSGSDLSWNKKNDNVINHDENVLTLNHDAVREIENFGTTYYSTVLGYLDGVRPQKREAIVAKENFAKISYINFTLLELFLFSVKANFYPKTFIAIRDLDKEILTYDSTAGYMAEWNKKNRHSYEIVYPPVWDERKVDLKMKDDLNFYFNIDVNILPQRVRCFVLKSTSGKIPLDSTRMTKMEKNSMMTVGSLLYFYNEKIGDMPMVNETGISEKVKIKVNKETIKDLAVLNAQLRAHNIYVEEGYRELDMVVFSKWKSNRLTN